LRASLGPFTACAASNLSAGSRTSRPRSRKAHLTLWAPFRVRASCPYPASYAGRWRRGQRWCPGFLVPSRLPAFASGPSCARCGVGPSLRSAYPAPNLRGGDRNGVATFDTDQVRPGRVLPLPRDGGVLPTDDWPSVGTCRFTAASPQPRWCIPSGGALLDEAYGSSLMFTLSVFPLPVAPGWDGCPWAFPRASHPAVARDARQGGDGLVDTGPGLHHHLRSSSRCIHWSGAASCRTQSQ
jgi:hypothetical protein